MPETLTKTVYSFAELSEDAKEKAREWWRELESSDFEPEYEDIATCADILGINLRPRPVKLMGGGTRYEPLIYFSGFSSQGDGACFEGTYSYAKGASIKIREHAPQDKELHRIADELQVLQKKHFYRLAAVTKHCGHYYHSGCMSVDIDNANSHAAEDALTQFLRDFADWIYRQLETEYEWRLSDENVDESILANEYTFTIEGKLAQ